MVAMFGYLFHGVWGFCVKCQSTFTAFSCVVFGLVPVGRHQCTCFFWLVARTNACKGLLCLMSGSRGCGGVMSIHYVVCVCVAHDVCVILRFSLVFLVFFVIWWWEERFIIVVLSQQYTNKMKENAEIYLEWPCAYVYTYIYAPTAVCTMKWHILQRKLIS